MLTTRRPTGAPTWPITAVIGRQSTGKSYLSIQASASDLVDRTFYLGIDERDPEDYSRIPGADFEIVDHDGTRARILAQLDAINAEPVTDGRPHLLVVDGVSRYWALIHASAQQKANARPRGRDARADVSSDLWADAAQEWTNLFDRLRAHHGPVIVTARVELEREWKIEGHKTLPFDVDAIIELPERGEYVVSKVTSVRYGLDGRRALDEFDFDTFWRDHGLDLEDATDRTYSRARLDVVDRPDDTSGRDWLAELDAAGFDTETVARLGTAARIAGASAEVKDAIRRRLSAINAPAPKPARGKTAAANTAA